MAPSSPEIVHNKPSRDIALQVITLKVDTAQFKVNAEGQLSPSVFAPEVRDRM